MYSTMAPTFVNRTHHVFSMVTGLIAESLLLLFCVCNAVNLVESEV